MKIKQNKTKTYFKFRFSQVFFSSCNKCISISIACNSFFPALVCYPTYNVFPVSNKVFQVRVSFHLKKRTSGGSSTLSCHPFFYRSCYKWEAMANIVERSLSLTLFRADVNFNQCWLMLIRTIVQVIISNWRV